MNIRRYEEQDFAQVRQWGLEWGAEYAPQQFPQTGFIIDGVAAYFLYQTDSSVCWLENLISKKGLSDEVRDEAISLLTEEALNEAKKKGFEVAYATTGLISLAKRAKESGASIVPLQFLITKDLTIHNFLQ